jgi:hypothetical protein
MKSLKHLVEKDGVTIVSVIHQPRKFIYDLFDSLILLGVGGRMVYHGPTENAESYFARLNYSLPQGESMADWLIDISSGRLEPDNHVAETKMSESFRVRKGNSKRVLALPSLRTVVSEDHQIPNNLLQPKSSLLQRDAWNSSKNPLREREVPINQLQPKPRLPRHEVWELSKKVNTEREVPDNLLKTKPSLPRREAWDSSKKINPEREVPDNQLKTKPSLPQREAWDSSKNTIPELEAPNNLLEPKPSLPQPEVWGSSNNDVLEREVPNNLLQPKPDGWGCSKNVFSGREVSNNLLQPKTSSPRREVWDSSKNAIPDGDVWSGGVTDNDIAIAKLWASMAPSTDQSPNSKDDDSTSGTAPLKECSDDSDQADAVSVESSDLVRKISFDGPRTPGSSFDGKDDFGSVDSPISRRSTSRLAAAGRVVTDGNCVGAKGVTTGKVVQAMEEAKERRAWLCEEWSKYFEKLGGEDKSIFEPPPKYDLPYRCNGPSLRSQFWCQFKRQVIVGWRNRFSKIIDFTVIVLAVITITSLDGISTVSIDDDPEITFGVMVRPLEDEIPIVFEQLFSYAMTYQVQYPLKVGIILSVLLGLTATKIVTSKRLEFFREAASGYNLNAYFGAISILSTLEHSVQAIVAAFFASWIRNPVASKASYYTHFLLLAWVTVAWALLIPMLVPADNVTLIAGFFFSFCGLMFSGAFAPITYLDIYEEGGFKEVFAGWISPTRFFYEALAVGEYRCLPEQSGYTIETSSVNRPANSSLTIALGYAGHDYSAIRWSCNGWYWSVVPVLLIGVTIRYLAIGAMHAMYRGQQTKRPLSYVIRENSRVAVATLFYCLGFAFLFSLTTWLFVRDLSFDEPQPPTRAEVLDRFGFFD